ncbi:aminoacetone oxidase family FAD-binding enzyme [Anaerosphaera multitolerans]|uniref:Aminoacetone oxidase family FAD-binding enzyme n=1 Tax=Anaerosphaera multitolerans TaxID=2487351 RepID=A0A437S521_9FIRM|nr:aminoacetone oxidase family FAD-binding enzyme [Anaerosphaera multitolerans]RVU54099.1 aminoacetone oxidase family FAD-binding enzyme [Anaerosphaera multitolerans]
MDIIVIGGGISGVFAAIELKKRGHNVIILEKNDRILKKMLVTGNGRCNLTNVKLSESNYNDSGDFTRYALSKFNNNDFKDYLNNLGIVTTEENNGKIYPITLKAQSVVNMLLEELKDIGVEILTSKKVISIRKKKKFIVRTDDEEYFADKIIFAVGGSSMPSSGSDGKSYKLLKELGHSTGEIFPALTQVKLDSKYLKHLSGVKVVSEIKLYKNREIVDRRYGEVLFTNYGISGPPVLDISRSVNFFKDDLTIEMSLINYVEKVKETKEELYNRLYTFQNYTIERWLLGVIDKKFIYMILDMLKLNADTPVNIMSNRDYNKLVGLLLSISFKVEGTKGFENSQVTKGGINIAEIDEKTFESKIIKDLYIVGEVMDVDGDCGGYNIQWAATSAIIAARSID